MSGDAPETLAARLLRGDRRALARAITLCESTRDDHREAARTLLERVMPAAGNSIRLGVTGVPGAGKSTFIEALGLHAVGLGRRVAVLPVDPSSPLGGGSLLGDKTRMVDLGRREEAFIRPSPAGGTMGGVTRRTREAVLLCEAAGYDVVVIETVGVGQSETAVAGISDCFLLLLIPGGGDELQGMKRGIVELADVILVNKADGALEAEAARAAVAYRGALSLLPRRRAEGDVPVRTCSAREGTGIAEAWELVTGLCDRRRREGTLAQRRAAQARNWLREETRERLLEELTSRSELAGRVRTLEEEVAAGRLPPPAAAGRLLDLFRAPAAGTAPGSLRHVAVAVPDLRAAAEAYAALLGADPSPPQPLPGHGVTACFFARPGTAAIELIEPLGDDSPIAAFLRRHPSGGVHHLCVAVDDIEAARDRLVAEGARVVGDPVPRPGAHGRPVLFLHPAHFAGVLIELEETAPHP